MKSAKFFIVALLFAVILAVLGTTPPRPAAIDTSPDAFSASRAMVDGERIARAPHPSGSAEHAALRGYLMQRLGQLGLTVRTQEGQFPAEARAELNRRSRGTEAGIPLTNVLGLLRGNDPSLPAAALMAHYDSVPGSPAAADDGAGVASILETLRALSLDRERKRDVLVILTDGEESGLLGARMFFEHAAEARRIGAIINLETRGGGGKANLFQTSALNGDVARLWADTVPHPAGTSLATFIYSVLPNDTDLTVALPHGYPAWNFAFIGRPGLYHSPLATAANLDRGSLQQMGEQTLGLTRALVHSRELPGRAPDIVFFDVFGLFAVHYAPWWGWVMLAIGFAGYAALAARRFEPMPFLGGAARMLGVVIVAAAVLQGLNYLSQGSGPSDYYDRLAAIPKLQVMALLVGIDVALLLAASGPTTRSGEAGLVLPLWLGGAVMQFLAPTAAYVLTVPLMLAGIAAWPWLRDGRAGRAVQVVVAAVVGGYALMLGYALMQAVGAAMPMVTALPLALLCMVFVPLRPVLRGQVARIASGGFLLLALAMALWVRWDGPAPTVPTYNQTRSLGIKG